MTRFRTYVPWMLLMLGLAGLLPWAGRPLVRREQELRVIVTARNMARGGSWLIPSYLDEPRLNKPPLMYWITAGAFRLAGTTQSPAVARLPGALCGAFLLLAIYGFGSRLIGRRRAFTAAAVAGSTYLFLHFGRKCETDMPLACFESISVLALYAALRAPGRFAWWALSGVTAGLGFMIKGPAAVVLPALAGLSYLLWPGAARPRLRAAGPVIWLGLVLLLGCPWYALVFLSNASQAAAGDVGYEIRALVAHSRHEPNPLFYLYTLPGALLPWGLLLPFAVVALWKAARRRAAARFVLAWLLSSLLAMSLIKSRQIHYATLLLAPSALAIGGYLAPLWSRRPVRRVAALGRYADGVNALFGLAGLICVALPLRFPLLSSAACAVTGVAILGVALTGLLLRRRSAAIGFGAAWLAAIGLANLYAWQLSEIVEPAGIVRDFARQAEPAIRNANRVFLAGQRLNTMRYYLDTRIDPVKDFAEGWQRAQPGDLLILASGPHQPVLPGPDAPLPSLAREQGGFSLRLFVKPSGLEPDPPGR